MDRNRAQRHADAHGQSQVLLRLDERGEIDHPAQGRFQLSRARHGNDAVHRRGPRSRRRGRDRFADRPVGPGDALRRRYPPRGPLRRTPRPRPHPLRSSPPAPFPPLPPVSPPPPPSPLFCPSPFPLLPPSFFFSFSFSF